MYGEGNLLSRCCERRQSSTLREGYRLFNNSYNPSNSIFLFSVSTQISDDCSLSSPNRIFGRKYFLLFRQKKIHFQPLEFSCEKKCFQQTLFAVESIYQSTRIPNGVSPLNVDFLFALLSVDLVDCDLI